MLPSTRTWGPSCAGVVDLLLTDDFTELLFMCMGGLLITTRVSSGLFLLNDSELVLQTGAETEPWTSTVTDCNITEIEVKTIAGNCNITELKRI